MFIKKPLFAKIATLGIIVSTVVCTPVMAATNSDPETKKGIVKSVETTDNGTEIEGMISGSGADDIKSLWLVYGPLYQYPVEGGKWEYGFWNAKVRSYYTVNRCHGSTVKLNKRESRSVDTAPGKKSIAELWAIQSDSNDRYYYHVCN